MTFSLQSRREFLQYGLGFLAAGVAPSRVSSTSADRKPNVLFVFSDQERENVPRSCLHLPNREKLEHRGVHFTRAFCTTPQCSASRATLLTGLYPHEAGVVANVDASSMGVPLSSELPCLGTVFQGAGYQTGYLGKWHLGDTKTGLEAFGFPGYRNMKDDDLAVVAADWITQQQSEPWFLIVSFLNPHDICQYSREPKAPIREGVSLPPNFEDSLENKPLDQKRFLTENQGKFTLTYSTEDWIRYRSYYCGLIEKVDGHLGVLLDALQKKGEQEDTIIVYTSDHGDMGGSHGLPMKGPFMYDELLNVPLVISYPKRFMNPVVTDSLVSLVDLVPTLCAMTGVRWPAPLSGVDLSPAMETPSRGVRTEIFAEYYGKQQWKCPIRTIRTVQWKYNFSISGEEELYDLESDPGELHNLSKSAEHTQTRLALSKQLHAWREKTRDPLL